MYHTFCIHFSVEGHLESFHFWLLQIEQLWTWWSIYPYTVNNTFLNLTIWLLVILSQGLKNMIPWSPDFNLWKIFITTAGCYHVASFDAQGWDNWKELCIFTALRCDNRQIHVSVGAANVWNIFPGNARLRCYGVLLFKSPSVWTLQIAIWVYLL